MSVATARYSAAKETPMAGKYIHGLTALVTDQKRLQFANDEPQKDSWFLA